MKRIQRKTLSAYKNEYAELVNNMQTGPDKDIILLNKELILSSFEIYENNLDHLERLTTSCLDNSELETALVRKFESANSFKDKIRSDIFSRKCPYCGYTSLEESIPVEHYVPKSKFKEYSLLGLNLFLCCKRCNSRKGNGWITSTRDTLNPYIDELYDREFLRVDIDLLNNKIVVNVRLDTGLGFSDEEASLLSRHFEKFQLIPRIKKFINTDISKLIEVAYIHEKERPGFCMDNYLQEKYLDLKYGDGTNSILTVVYKYFIDNPNVLSNLLKYHKSTKT